MFLISAIINDELIDPALNQAQAAHQQRQKFGCHANFPKFLLSLAETREQQQLPEQEQIALNGSNESEVKPGNRSLGCCDRNDAAPLTKIDTPFVTTIDVQSEII